MKFIPMSDKVLVEPDLTEENSGLIVRPETSRKKPTTGYVVAVGPKVREVKKGNKIITNEFSGEIIRVNNREHRLIKESDIAAVL